MIRIGFIENSESLDLRYFTFYIYYTSNKYDQLLCNYLEDVDEDDLLIKVFYN